MIKITKEEKFIDNIPQEIIYWITTKTNDKAYFYCNERELKELYEKLKEIFKNK